MQNFNGKSNQSPPTFKVWLGRTGVLGLSWLSLSLCLSLREPVDDGPVEHVHATGWTGLLALEPGLQAGRVEDVSAWQLLAPRHHLLSTDDADVVDCLQLLDSGIRIAATNQAYA